MQTITQHIFHQQKKNAVASNKWLQRLYATGFAFFLIKGLVWIAAAVWVVY